MATHLRFRPLPIPNLLLSCLFLGLGLVLLLSSPLQSAPQKSRREAVQILTGYIYPNEREVYRVTNLKKGDTLFVSMQNLSGNLDPLFAIANANYNLAMFDVRLQSLLEQEPENPYHAFRDLLSSFYLAWDDDSGQGSDAALQFAVPADGDYKIVVAGSRQPVGRTVEGLTFGAYRLSVGRNAPQILSGRATSDGSPFVKLEDAQSFRPRIQEVTGTLTPEHNTASYRLTNLDAGAMLYARVEATDGNLKPVLSLKNYGNKVMRVDNLAGTQSLAQFQHPLREEARNFSLQVIGSIAEGAPTSGSYRLRVGLNAPEILADQGKPAGAEIILAPIKVGVGLQMDQITEVNQKGENFGIVGTMQLQWQDPDFAFNPDSCECDHKVFTISEFEHYLTPRGLEWPRFIFFNQQGKRWSQAEFFSVYPGGEVRFHERFSATLQAPDFNFRAFPFDTQEFFIRLLCVLPESRYVFKTIPALTRVGRQLGEEEWFITKQDATIKSFTVGSNQYSEFSFRFLAKRHLSYYVFRIFLPLLLIITVSWVTFFLKDYTKRIDISGANLLVFIAFNFTIASDLPRLGYLTLLDTMLIVAFVVTTLTVICNVVLKRLDTHGRTELTEEIDSYIIPGYPIFYFLGFSFLFLIFFF